MTREIQFRAKAYESPEAQELRRIESEPPSKPVRLARQFMDSEWYMLAMLSVVPGVISTLGAFIGLPQAILGLSDGSESFVFVFLGGGVALLAPALIPILVNMPSKRRERRAVLAAEKEAERAKAELQKWLTDNYGVTVSVESGIELLRGQKKNLRVSIFTPEGVPIQNASAQLTLVNGGYALTKKSVDNVGDSAYFESNSFSPQLDAGKGDSAALSIERD